MSGPRTTSTQLIKLAIPILVLLRIDLVSDLNAKNIRQY